MLCLNGGKIQAVSFDAHFGCPATQVLFLLYHYYETKEAYSAIRLFIAAYVWMTGFGNFTYYYKTNDFNIGRFCQMMWRLNFLVFFCCVVRPRVSSAISGSLTVCCTVFSCSCIGIVFMRFICLGVNCCKQLEIFSLL